MISIPNPYAALLISAVRDAVIYQEGLLRSETIRDRSEHEEHYVYLTEFFEFLKKEYRNQEAEIGFPLEKLL
ncbi:hypothetical protein ACNI65_01365 [Roseateles sp. So40a]|uniref:hypothetical protein n=1 Tax=Roseateles sp. So40a TaxID=3400226 RepID=UPI003A89D16F